VILELRVRKSTGFIAGQRTYRRKSCWKGLFSFTWPFFYRIRVLNTILI